MPSVGSGANTLRPRPPGAMRTSRPVRCGWSSARRTAVPPPRELPTQCARSMPRCSGRSANRLMLPARLLGSLTRRLPSSLLASLVNSSVHPSDARLRTRSLEPGILDLEAELELAVHDPHLLRVVDRVHPAGVRVAPE